MSAIVSVVLPFPRYFMVGGITIIALVFFSPQLNDMGSLLNFESILPFVINNYVPAGLTGLLLAGFLAAFMSTFDSTVNAGAAYLVNDIYKRYLKPGKTGTHYVRIGYAGSVLVVIAGILLGLNLESIDQITQWLFAALFSGYAVPNVLKWHWWRFNGFGYFWGMIGGIAGAVIIPVLCDTLTPLQSFPFIVIVSLLGSIAGSYLTQPQDMEELKSFYRQVRPWGWWRPVHDAVLRAEPTFQSDASAYRDLFNVATGIVWQFTIMILPVFIILRSFEKLMITVFLLILTSIILKINWFDKLEAD
jgi:Na+/proline symporter